MQQGWYRKLRSFAMSAAVSMDGWVYQVSSSAFFEWEQFDNLSECQWCWYVTGKGRDVVKGRFLIGPFTSFFTSYHYLIDPIYSI